MERELATHWEDLPHAFVPASDREVASGTVKCRCSRPFHDPLHSPTMIEQASERSMLVTEKGS